MAESPSPLPPPHEGTEVAAAVTTIGNFAVEMFGKEAFPNGNTTPEGTSLHDFIGKIGTDFAKDLYAKDPPAAKRLFDGLERSLRGNVNNSVDTQASHGMGITLALGLLEKTDPNFALRLANLNTEDLGKFISHITTEMRNKQTPEDYFASVQQQTDTIRAGRLIATNVAHRQDNLEGLRSLLVGQKDGHLIGYAMDATLRSVDDLRQLHTAQAQTPLTASTPAPTAQ